MDRIHRVRVRLRGGSSGCPFEQRLGHKIGPLLWPPPRQCRLYRRQFCDANLAPLFQLGKLRTLCKTEWNGVDNIRVKYRSSCQQDRRAFWVPSPQSCIHPGHKLSYNGFFLTS
jgi:hypothetical protein